MFKMTKMFGFPVLAALILCFASSAIDAAEYNGVDIDYDVYVGSDVTRYEIWVEPEVGSPYMDSSWPSLNEASYRLFKMVEWNLIPHGAEVEIEQSTSVGWVFLERFETLSEAEAATEDWKAIGLYTKIVPIFQRRRFAISPSLSSRDTRFLLNVASLLEDD